MKKKKVRKFNKRKTIFSLLFIIIIVFIILYIYGINIKNIIVKGNTIYTDQEIIELAKINNYPSTFSNLSGTISNRLEKNQYIKRAKVHKFLFTKVTITVEENLPIFYYVPDEITVLKDGEETEDYFSVPTVINYIPDTIYKDFLSNMQEINYSILTRISEIKYDPNEVDENRFLLTMNDGNKVYLTISKFNKIDNYLTIIKEFNNKKGTLYLDSGEYFKVKS